MPDYIRAGDATAWQACKRRAWYDHHLPAGELEADAFELLIQERGQAHEEQIREELTERFGSTVEANSPEHTHELMAAKTPIIYQAAAVDERDRLIGKPDFLILQEDGLYQIADAKLASSIKNRTDIKIQLAIYRRLFHSGLPALAYLGSGEIAEVGTEMDEKCESFINDMHALLASEQRPAASFSFSKCSVCPYQSLCVPEFEKQEELTLLYDVREKAAQTLCRQGIKTLSDLAQAQSSSIPDMPFLKGDTKKQMAIWRAQSYLTGDVKQVRPVELPEGIWLHFDIESNPLASEGLGAEVYLWGFLAPEYTTQDFEYFWSDGGEAEDYKAWSDFLSYLEGYRKQSLQLVIAHYSHFEITQIKTYAARYGMEDNVTVRWLLGNDSPLFDIQKTVKDALVLPLKGYGLKAICKDPRLVNFQWELEESGSQWSVVRYIDFLQATNTQQRETIKHEILSYNRDDVKATRALEVWLRQFSTKPVISR